MKIEILKNETFIDETTLPRQATEKSSGFDIIAATDPMVEGTYHEDKLAYSNVVYIQYKTNLKMAIRSDATDKYSVINYDVLAFPRSSVSKYNLILANSIGLIDQDYRGEVMLRFKYIWQPEDLSIIDGKIYGNINYDKIYKKGNPIAQLKITQCENVEFMLVDEFNDITNRGEGGFGHSDEKSTIEKLYERATFNFETPKPYVESIKERELQ